MTARKAPSRAGNRKQLCHHERPQIVRGCKHDYHFYELSRLPTCSKCKGVVSYGQWEYTQAAIEAGMKSSRGNTYPTWQDR